MKELEKSRYAALPMRVVVTHDIFRSRTCGLVSIEENPRWIYTLLQVALRGFDVDLRQLKGIDDGGTFDSGSALDRMQVPRTPAGWAQMVAQRPPATLPELEEYHTTDLVVGFGLTPWLIRWFHSAGARVLDVELSPIRFGHKYYFRARTTCPMIAEELKRLQVSEDEIARGVQILKGRAVRAHDRPSPSSSVGVVFGQSQIDLSLVEHGRIVSLEHDQVFKRVHDLARTVDELHVVPHPNAFERPSNLHRLIAEIPNAVLEQQRSYSYLTHEAVKFATALSSSTLVEAGYFDIPARQLIVPDRDRPEMLPNSITEWIDVQDGLFAPTLWRAIIGGRPAPTLWRAIIGGRPATEPVATSKLQGGLIAETLGRGVSADPNATIFEPPPRLARGARIETTVNGPHIFRYGWHPPEVWGTWSSGHYACLAFHIEGRERLRVDIETQIFVTHPDYAPEIKVRATGMPDFVPAVFRETDGWQLLSLQADPAENGSLFVVVFQILSPTSPADFRLSDDHRRLGVGVHSILLQSLASIAETDLLEDEAKAFRRASRTRSPATELSQLRDNALLPFVSVLGRLGPKRVVECGTGNGAFAGAMAVYAQEVLGLDWNPSKHFPHSARGVRFQIWDATTDPVPEADLVCSANLLEHLPSEALPDALVRILRAAESQFHVIACHDDGLLDEVNVDPPAVWLARFLDVAPGFRLLDAPVGSEHLPVAVITNIAPERLKSPIPAAVDVRHDPIMDHVLSK